MSTDLACMSCGHSDFDHNVSAEGCVYGWGDWQSLTDAERSADPCECVRFVEAPDPIAPYQLDEDFEDAISAIEANGRAKDAARRRE